MSFSQQDSHVRICGTVLSVSVLVHVNKFTYENHGKHDTSIALDLAVRAFNYTLQQCLSRRNLECPWHQEDPSRKPSLKKPKQRNPRKARILRSFLNNLQTYAHV